MPCRLRGVIGQMCLAIALLASSSYGCWPDVDVPIGTCVERHEDGTIHWSEDTPLAWDIINEDIDDCDDVEGLCESDEYRED